MSLDLTDDKSTLVQVMAWCRQATSHYRSQCWRSFCRHMASLGPNELIPKGSEWLVGTSNTNLERVVYTKNLAKWYLNQYHSSRITTEVESEKMEIREIGSMECASHWTASSKHCFSQGKDITFSQETETQKTAILDCDSDNCSMDVCYTGCWGTGWMGGVIGVVSTVCIINLQGDVQHM